MHSLATGIARTVKNMHDIGCTEKPCNPFGAGSRRKNTLLGTHLAGVGEVIDRSSGRNGPGWGVAEPTPHTQ